MKPEGFRFEVLKTRGHARAGLLHTPHGTIPTPVFMPVGTQGTVKAMSVADLQTPPLDAKIILGNTYHLYLRPGLEVIAAHGGLHGFAGWNRAILTDSGGFQVFSLSTLNKMDQDGVTFRSHIDGSEHRLTPEISMEIQRVIGSDIAMAFDHCPPGDASSGQMDDAMATTTRWAERCAKATHAPGQAVFGIIQGGPFVDKRKRHIAEITQFDFDGYAMGGFSVGEPVEIMHEVLGQVAHEMPHDKPRYLMGVGTPLDLTVAITAGIDMFDCVMPTRNARNGSLFTSQGKVVISHSAHRLDTGPLDPACPCVTCTTVSRSYLRHLFMAKEILYSRLATLHNLTFYARHVGALRQQILDS